METKSAQKGQWPTIGLSSAGALLGMVLGQTHEIYHTLECPGARETHFLYILIRLIGFTLGSALLLGGIADLRNRVVRAGHF